MQPRFPCRKKKITTACRRQQRENRIDTSTPNDRHFDNPDEFRTFRRKDWGKTTATKF